MTEDATDPIQPPARRPRRAVRVVALVLSALVLVGALTAVSVALITPDLLGDPCQRPQLVAPSECVTAAPTP